MFESLEEMLQITYQNDSKLFKTISKFKFCVEIKSIRKLKNTKIKQNKRKLCK